MVHFLVFFHGEKVKHNIGASPAASPHDTWLMNMHTQWEGNCSEIHTEKNEAERCKPREVCWILYIILPLSSPGSGIQMSNFHFASRLTCTIQIYLTSLHLLYCIYFFNNKITRKNLILYWFETRHTGIPRPGAKLDASSFSKLHVILSAVASLKLQLKEAGRL